MNQVIQGNIFDKIKEIPDEFIDCIITSPPYFRQRIYKCDNVIIGGDLNHQHNFQNIKQTKVKLAAGKGGHSREWREKASGITQQGICECGAFYGLLGFEPSSELYIKHLMLVFNECQRIIKKTGVFFLNIDDTYNGSGGLNAGINWAKQSKDIPIEDYISRSGTRDKDYPQKSQLGIPFRLTIKLLQSGWLLRNTIIWQKPNALPENVTDRFTNDFEYIFFLTKNKNYYFNQLFERYTEPLNRWGGDILKDAGNSKWSNETNQYLYRKRNLRPNEKGRNMRTTWNINTRPSGENHFATYPEELIIRMIESGCPDDGVVFDPFAGIGTTLCVAKKWGRQYLGIELSPEYCKAAERKLLEILI